MNDVLRTLLSLDSLPTDEGAIRLAWERELPLWAWIATALLALALAWVAYRGIPGHRSLRGVLAACRAAIILLVIALLAGPVAELPREDVEQDWVMMLVDRSRSMGIVDVPDTSIEAVGGDVRLSRDRQVEDALDGAAEQLAVLEDQKEVRWYGFHEGLFDLGDDPATDPQDDLEGGDGTAISDGPDLGEAAGVRTDIARAVEQALQRAGGRPISALVLMSDGRTTRGLDPAVTRRLRGEGVPIIAVPLGSRDPIGDLSVGRVDAPSRAFVGDKVPVRLDVDRLGPAVAGGGATVRLVDETTGETLDELRIESGAAADEELTLVAEPDLAGETTWSVIVEPDEPDLVPENNRVAFGVELVDRPMRVLFVDGYPRWEYRYLKNLLIRESSIESSNFLLSADRDFAQEGNAPITRLPRSTDEWEPFDVLVIGDVPAGFFSPEQMELIRDQVANAGAGVLFIGGERSMPATYEDSILADLLPFGGGLRLPALGRPVTIAPTAQAERLGILQLVLGGQQGWPDALLDPETGWSQLQWAQRIEPSRLKPTAEALAATVQSIDGTPHPIVVHMRFGAGQSIYVATDEIWRWRFGRGELLPEQFWIQMVRMLARERLAASGVPAILEADPQRTVTGQPVQIRLRLLDARLTEDAPSTVSVEITGADGSGLGRLELVPEPGVDGRYVATWLPDSAGEVTLRVDEPSLRDLGLAAPLSIREPADELLRPETDHDLLARLAAETGGRVVAPEALGPALETLPNREVRTENPLRESIWDTPAAFILLLGLLTLEWVGRRNLRLA